MTIGFIGCGNMGGAIARAVYEKTGGSCLYLADAQQKKAQALADCLNAKAVSNEQAALCDFVFLGVKPQHIGALLDSLRDTLASRQDSFVLITMVAGYEMAQIQQKLGLNAPVIRIMPNTPVFVGEGLIAYCAGEQVSKAQKEAFVSLMQYAGMLDEIPETMIDAASCVSGCGPAWAYQMIEALADGGVACGMPRDKAYAYAAQMLVGSGKMVLQKKDHPAALKDQVCSPGGSTIQGVRVLEERGFRGAVMDAVIAAYEKTKLLGK